jgi:uncharacterized membrane protein YkvA (DUF1232 family)
VSPTADVLDRASRRTRKAARDLKKKVTPRRGAKRTLMATISLLPNYLRLLYGLFRDKRVPLVDKALVVGAIAYIVMPMDFIPDYIPFLGEVDDVFLLMTALQRLLMSAGQRTVLSHWHGDPNELEPENIGRVLSAAAFFLPHRMRKRLKRKALRGRR